jgi:predicted transcriptional regulator
MTGKQRMAEILDTLPDDATWEDVLDAIRLDRAVQESIAAAERGELIPHEEVVQSTRECLARTSK